MSLVLTVLFEDRDKGWKRIFLFADFFFFKLVFVIGYLKGFKLVD